MLTMALSGTTPAAGQILPRGANYTVTPTIPYVSPRHRFGGYALEAYAAETYSALAEGNGAIYILERGSVQIHLHRGKRYRPHFRCNIADGSDFTVTLEIPGITAPPPVITPVRNGDGSITFDVMGAGRSNGSDYTILRIISTGPRRIVFRQCEIRLLTK
ncbi:MAG: hypothetical protein ACOYKQ_02410 [Polymorphobacter sp.]